MAGELKSRLNSIPLSSTHIKNDVDFHPIRDSDKNIRLMGPLVLPHFHPESPSWEIESHILRSCGSVKLAVTGVVVVLHTAAAHANAGATMLLHIGSPTSTVLAERETPP